MVEENPVNQTPTPAPQEPRVDTTPILRSDGRRADELRPIRFQNGIAPYALGSTLVEWGCTRIICAVTVEEAVPKWIKDQGLSGGWITAEYSMLPYSTIERKPREITKGRADGRVQEIQRLIGRAVRAVVNLEKIGSRTLWIDCDVIQADGGTRTASITGAYVALVLAVRKMLSNGLITENPILDSVAAVSLGIVGGRMLLDLNYTEDSTADVDLNLVMTGSGRIIEVQGTGERTTFDETQLLEMLKLGRSAIQTLTSLQSSTLAHTTFG